eukprot:scaffold4883_cov62-Phaeocystis_antarctica.AAC.3
MADDAPRVLDRRLHLLELLHDVGVERRRSLLAHRVELGLEAREVSVEVRQHIEHRRLDARRFDLVKLRQARLLEQSAPGLGSGCAHAHRAAAQTGHGRAQHRVGAGQRGADEQHIHARAIRSTNLLGNEALRSGHTRPQSANQPL